MKIYNKQGAVLFEVILDDNSYRVREIMGEHSLNLIFRLPRHIEIPIGSYCLYDNKKYTLLKKENFRKQSSHDFEYSVIMESDEMRAKTWLFINPNDGKLKFSLTGKPINFLEMLVENLNKRDGGWSVGTCIEANEKCIAFNHEFCLDVAKRIADEFETEFSFDNKKVSFGKVEFNKANPLPLAYGMGKGFIPGTRRESENAYPIDILYIQGSDRNIDYSSYMPDGTHHSDTLMLPISQKIWFDGVDFYIKLGDNSVIKFDEERGVWASAPSMPESARCYISSPNGDSLRRFDKVSAHTFENSTDCTHIYPSRVGTITSVETEEGKDSDGNPYTYYNVIDSTIPESLDYKQCQIGDEKITMKFQSGMLSGREFDVDYIHEGRKFKIYPTETDGYLMPEDVYIPKVEDKYAIFGIQLPQPYLCNDATKTGASWDMFRYAVKFMFENEDQKVNYRGELDPIYARKNWLNIGGKIVLGGYVRLDDPEFSEAMLVRIVSIKDFINKPQKPQIELSNIVSASGFMQRIDKLESDEVVNAENRKEDRSYTQRRFRDVKETTNMLNAEFRHYASSIQPVSVQTMQAIVGDDNLQFRFVKENLTDTDKSFIVLFNQETKQLHISGGCIDGISILQHMTKGVDQISPNRDYAALRHWHITPYTSAPISEMNKDVGFYVYARCRILGETTTADPDRFYLSDKPMNNDEIKPYFFFLIGILNSEFNGDRSFVPMYGFTEILPGQITTNKIVSNDGQCFIDLLNNAFHIGDSASHIDWNNNKYRALLAKNCTISATNSQNEEVYSFSGDDGSGQLAKGNLKWDAGGNIEGNGGTFKNIVVSDGAKIAGFKVHGEVITNEGENNNAAMVFQTQSGNIHASMGANALPVSAGGKAPMCVMNSDSSGTWGVGINNALIASASGKRDCRAILMNGGSIAGLAYNTIVVSSSMTIRRDVTNIVLVNDQEISLILPTMRLEDNGHVIRIKRLGAGLAKFTMSSCYTYDQDSSRFSAPAMVYYNGGSSAGLITINVNYGGSYELVWCRDMGVKIGQQQYHGCWIQYLMM